MQLITCDPTQLQKSSNQWEADATIILISFIKKQEGRRCILPKASDAFLSSIRYLMTITRKKIAASMNHHALSSYCCIKPVWNKLTLAANRCLSPISADHKMVKITAPSVRKKWHLGALLLDWNNSAEPLWDHGGRSLQQTSMHNIATGEAGVEEESAHPSSLNIKDIFFSAVAEGKFPKSRFISNIHLGRAHRKRLEMGGPKKLLHKPSTCHFPSRPININVLSTAKTYFSAGEAFGTVLCSSLNVKLPLVHHPSWSVQ